MATNYNARIATRGLTFVVDAANPASLPTNIPTNLVPAGSRENLSTWIRQDTTIQTDVTTAPDGTLTADVVFDTSSNSTHLISFNAANVQVSSGSDMHTWSVYVKAGNQISNITLILFGPTSQPSRQFNLLTGTSSGSVLGNAATIFSIAPAGNGWYRCSVSGPLNTAANTLTIYLFQNNNFSYTGGTGSIFLWGAQCEPGSTLTPYYPVSTINSNLNTRWNDVTGTSRPVSSGAPIITVIPPVGQQEFTTPGTYSWTAPADVTSVSAVVVGGGSAASGYFGVGGAGGGLAYKNNIPVIPGNSYTVVVGAGGVSTGGGINWTGNPGGLSSFTWDSGTVTATGGITTGGVGAAGGSSVGGAPSGTFDGGGSGGGCPGPYSTGASAGSGAQYYGSGGGGAGGYSGNGGRGGGSGGGNGNGIYLPATAGQGGGGGGGQGQPAQNTASDWNDGGGGGVGIYGQGTSGAAGVQLLVYNVAGQCGGGGGSGGANGASPASASALSPGGLFGGGGGSNHANGSAPPGGSGGGGAVRIIWGSGRSYPAAAASVTPSSSVIISTAQPLVNVSYGSFINVTTPVGYDSRNSGALVFNNLDNYVAFPDLPSQTNSPLSVFAWVFLNATPTGTNGIWGHYGVNSNNVHYEINPTATRLRLGDTNKGDLPMLAVGSWQFVGFTSTGSSHSYYVNGVLSTTWTGATGTILGGTGGFPSSHMIGRSDAGRTWNGRIANVAIYNAELTAAEVLNNFNALRGRYAV